eukprot:Blabericola_migrator_1__2762@NODE_178_length_11905_cov_212_545362_g155_i0_p5_GENE_NODE_178_length_11905_cov_212_545362_g155_i0NODE_178_length_11905_cov_212_545362_g155_i0_p5_ORF_typecomplete_len189_score23_79_NODE_178_length_11905_cov_212_545362_g155_i036344200
MVTKGLLLDHLTFGSLVIRLLFARRLVFKGFSLAFFDLGLRGGCSLRKRPLDAGGQAEPGAAMKWLRNHIISHQLEINLVIQSSLACVLAAQRGCLCPKKPKWKPDSNTYKACLTSECSQFEAYGKFSMGIIIAPTGHWFNDTWKVHDGRIRQFVSPLATLFCLLTPSLSIDSIEFCKTPLDSAMPSK